MGAGGDELGEGEEGWTRPMHFAYMYENWTTFKLF
jgi:hypothetical protein